jgi:hypothetical protein
MADSNTATSPGANDASSWLKQRSAIFNNPSPTTNTTNTPVKSSAKVVDKELARLKNMGAVNSVWSNKFVQEDTGGTDIKRTSPTSRTSSPLPSSEPPLSPRRYKVNTSPRPNANYIPVTGARQSFSTPTAQPTSPKSPSFNDSKFNIRARTLSGNNKKMADDISAALQSEKSPEIQPTHSKQNSFSNSMGYFSKASMSSLDLNEAVQTEESSFRSSRSSNGSSLMSPTASVHNGRGSVNSVSSAHEMEAANLWFQCETLKTQFAQTNARLNRANDDLEFYKRQMEQQGQVHREGMAAVVEEKEKETLRVRQLAELIVKQDQLLNEYEIQLECLTRLTNESAYLDQTQAEMEGLRQELGFLHKQREEMEGNIEALRAELEMSYSQMRLMMAVSTEIQNEFENYKTRIDAEVKTLLSQRQAEHEAELKALEEKLSATPVVATAAATAAVTATAVAATDRSVAVSEESSSMHQEEMMKVTEALKAAESGKLNAEKEAAAATAQVDSLRSQVISLTEALEEKDRAVLDLESQLKAQKMTMDTQMMELTQSILEKDILLTGFMGSRNNSREVVSSQQPDALGRSMASATVAPVSLTNSFYHPHEDNTNSEAHLQMSQVRQYMYSSSDDDDEDESEVLIMSYSTDEDEEVGSNVVDQSNNTLHHGHYHQMMNANNQSNTPHSPAETISSTISSTITFDSSEEEEEEEEKVAEIKHFSYSSVQSQATRPVSLISTTGSNSAASDNEGHHRLSGTGPVAPARFSITKETNANWPMPPPTPPPSEPLPPVPVVTVENKQVSDNQQQEEKVTSPIAKIQESSLPPLPTSSATAPANELEQMTSIVPPPRRARSKTMARDEAPDFSAYTTSVHQNNELPRIVPVQKPNDQEANPVPPPRKDASTAQHTKWMDDPESEEDDLWCDTESKQPEWNAVAV